MFCVCWRFFCLVLPLSLMHVLNAAGIVMSNSRKPLSACFVFASPDDNISVKTLCQKAGAILKKALKSKEEQEQKFIVSGGNCAASNAQSFVESQHQTTLTKNKPMQKRRSLSQIETRTWTTTRIAKKCFVSENAFQIQNATTEKEIKKSVDVHVFVFCTLR